MKYVIQVNDSYPFDTCFRLNQKLYQNRNPLSPYQTNLSDQPVGSIRLLDSYTK